MADDSSAFTAFFCPKCGTEIEATLDMIGESTLCPACGAQIVVPEPNKNDGVVRHGADDAHEINTAAMKSRTIRIELGDL